MKNSFRLTGRKHIYIALFACAIVFLPWAARSGTWNAGDYAALTNATACSTNGDTIAISQNITVSNAVAINDKGLTIEGNDYLISVPVPGFNESGVTNGNSASTFGVFTIDASGKTNFIQNLTVKGGNAAGAINNASGGTLVLEDMTIAQSGGPDQGGGGVVNSGTVYLQNCNVSRNGAQYGGGFLNGGTMFIVDCTFSENRSLSAGGGGGGGVNIGGNLYANNSTFAHNKSTELGGGFEQYLSGDAFFVDCTFAGNIAYNTDPTLKGGAIAQVASDGSVTVVNSLFAYNYWNNSGTYELNDLEHYSGAGSISAYYSVFHSTTNELGISVSNTLYAGATNGSNDSIFAGGANAIVLDAGGVPLGTNTIYQPFLVRLAATNLPTALLQSNASPSFAAGKGCRAAFSSSQTTPVVGYYSNNTQWVDLSGADSSNFEVLDDQNGANRTNSLIVGAAVGTASNLFMLKVVATNGGTVSGATVYGDNYPSGTVVTVTAIAAVGKRFDRWDYVLGGSGTASSNNPYLVAVNTNITLLPVFSNFDGFTITYSGNGYTGGTVPSQQVVENGGSTNISGPGTMVKEGYAFTNWNTRSDGNGTDYASGASYSGPDNLMLYAKWSLVVQMAVLGTNGAAIASGEAANTTNGTDFGSLAWGSALTNTFAITNSGNGTLVISGVTTNGAGAGAFSIFNFPFSIGVGTVSNLNIRFTPSNAGTYTAAVQIANNSTTTPYIVYLAGTGSKHDQTITNFPNPGDQLTTNTVHLSAQASSGLAVTNFTIISGFATINSLTNVTFTSSGSVSIAASQPGDTNWNSAPAVTNTFNVSKASQTITNFPSIPDQVVTSTVSLSAAADSGLPVSFGIGSGPATISGNTNLTFTATGVVSIVASQTGNNFYAVAPAMTNTFNVLPAPVPPVQDGWLAIHVTPVGGSWQLTAPAGYTGPTSGTGNLAAVSAVTGQYGVSYGALSGYVAPSNQTQFVTGGATSLFAGVYLQISPNIGTPAGVSATEGTYTNRIRVTWQGVDGATGYEIWRSQTNDANAAGRIADIPLISLRLLTSSSDISSSQPSAFSLQSTAYYYDDYNINPINAYYYWVRAKTSSLISPMSYVGMGYAAVDPHAASGTADIAAGDFVYLPVNATNLSHAGTVSFRLGNNGPDALTSSAVAFDFQMGTNAASMVWIGSAQSNVTLSVGGEELIILNSSAKRGLSVRGDLTGVQTVMVTVRHLSALNDPNLANNTATAAGSVRVKGSGVNSIGRALNDYDGDGKADLALCATNGSGWSVLLSGTKYRDSVDAEPGQSGWIGVPGDYEGDGRTDVGVYVPALGFWYVWFSDGGHGEYGYLGGPEFSATQSDFDGDAKTDPVVYRARDGYWLGGASARGYALCHTFIGGRGYEPVMVDYDGDRVADPAVYNQTTGLWIFSLSNFGYQLITGLFGDPNYLAVPADYDGDGLADPAIYAPATADWQILLSSTLSTEGYYTLWSGVVGHIDGIPVPADYDGDGKADLGVYLPAVPSAQPMQAGHPEGGIWEGLLSAYGYQLIWGGFGGAEYQPVME